MSTRIKQVVSMPVQTDAGANTAAMVNEWVAAFEQVMLAAGFVRTADTGQLGTVSATPANNALIGYRVYALQDEFSATSPLYLIAYFRNIHVGVPPATTNFRTRAIIQACLATDGAGNPIGAYTDLTTYWSSGSSTSVSRQTNAWSAYAWRKEHVTAVVIGPGAAIWSFTDSSGVKTVCQAQLTFIVARRRDRQGTVVPGEFILIGAPHNYLTAQHAGMPWPICKILSASGALNIGPAGGVQALEPVSDFSLKDNLPVVQFPIMLRATDMSIYGMEGIGAYMPADMLAPDSTITLTGTDGVQRPYLCIGMTSLGLPTPNPTSQILTGSSNASIPASSSPVVTNHGLCLDWSD